MSDWDKNGTDSFDPTQYEFDPRPSDNLPVPIELIFDANGDVAEPKERIAVIRTSDRMTFRRCRRKWGWSSHLRGNLGANEGQSPLWMGSGFHFALEDFHGHNRFGHPAEAFKAYHDATRRHDPKMLPPDVNDLLPLADGMLHYYADQWLVARSPLKTFWFEGQPQVEVNFRVNIPFDPEKLAAYGYDRVVYSGTLDRVIEDENGLLWIVEYKTAKSIQTLHLAKDSQVTSYCWAGNLLYGRPIAGVIYQQHRKDIPREPRFLASGKLSLDKSQLITHRSLRQVLINLYGEAQRAPAEAVELLNYLAKEEKPEGDKFILRSKVERNQHQCETEGVKILLEAEEMLNPNLALYPNPDRSCAFMCSFNGPCESLDDGSDWQYELALTTKPREPVYDSWREKVRWPDRDDRIFALT